jgi:hypothetical protein
MVTVRNRAEFRSDLPTDLIETDDDIIQHGGKSVAVAIGEMLERLGCKVEGPIYADFKGWELDVDLGRRRFWARVTYIEDFLLVFTEVRIIEQLFRRHSPEYLDLLSKLAREMANDPRFHDVGWHSDEDVLSGEPGTRDPVIQD